MFAFTALVAVAAMGLPKALAHGGVLSYANAGTVYPGWQPYNSPSGQTSIQRPWSSYNPILSATDATIACNDDGTAGALQQTAASIAAGSSITAYWNQIWPHPIGYMFTYLANCNGACTGVNAKTLEWFKIDQSGLLSGNAYSGTWGSGQMINQNSSWTTTIPKTVPSGNYMIRFETVAMHSLPAQFYPECAQITITGGGSVAPTSAQLVKFPGGYSNSDPAFTLDVYSEAAKTTTSITMPGPPLYGSSSSGGGGGGSSVSSSKPSSTSAVPTTTAKSSTAAPTSSGSSSSGAAQYAQCGGQGFTGPTTCASPYKCTVSNQYYSQCL